MRSLPISGSGTVSFQCVPIPSNCPCTFTCDCLGEQRVCVRCDRRRGLELWHSEQLLSHDIIELTSSSGESSSSSGVMSPDGGAVSGFESPAPNWLPDRPR